MGALQDNNEDFGLAEVLLAKAETVSVSEGQLRQFCGRVMEVVAESLGDPGRQASLEADLEFEIARFLDSATGTSALGSSV
jgi:hypothetical protein